MSFGRSRLEWQALWLPENSSFNSDSYQTFLNHLLSQFSGPIILIQDGAKYHTSQATRKFFEQHQDRLIVYQLPSYSPDYNPIEYL